MQLNALGFGDNKCSSASVKLYSAAWFGVFFNSEVLNFAGCSYGEDYIYICTHKIYIVGDKLHKLQYLCPI